MSSDKFEIGEPLDFSEEPGEEHDDETYLVTCLNCGSRAVVCGECLRNKGIRCHCYDE